MTYKMELCLEQTGDLKPCPFCGGTDIFLEPKGYWGGIQTHITHYELRHWCPPSGAKSSRAIIFEGLTEEETRGKWNRRHKPATPIPAPEITGPAPDEKS